MNKVFRRGFTLIEMMVAIAIIAISAMIIYSSNSNAVRHQAKLEEITLGHWLLLNEIEREKLNRVVQPIETADELKTRSIDIGKKEYKITRKPLDTDSDIVVMVEFSIEIVEAGSGDYVIDRIITMMPRSKD